MENRGHLSPTDSWFCSHPGYLAHCSRLPQLLCIRKENVQLLNKLGHIKRPSGIGRLQAVCRTDAAESCCCRAPRCPHPRQVGRQKFKITADLGVVGQGVQKNKIKYFILKCWSSFRPPKAWDPLCQGEGTSHLPLSADLARSSSSSLTR